MKRRKLTSEGEARIDQVADLRIKARQEIPTNKALGKELDLVPLYAAQLVSKRIREKLKRLTIPPRADDAKIPPLEERV